MEFKKRTLMEIADMICGNFEAEKSFFRYRRTTVRLNARRGSEQYQPMNSSIA
jgi:hypothetical protein